MSDSTQKETSDNPKKKRLRDWEDAVDKQIREAMERGDFDNLPGKGKPLDLDFNPFVPEEMRQAYRILENAGVAPDWIEQDKDIRAEKMALESMLRAQTRQQRQGTARFNTRAPDEIIAEHERLARLRDKFIARFRERAAALNKLIDTYNLKAPNSRVHHARIQIEDEIEKFLDACKTSNGV